MTKCNETDFSGMSMMELFRIEIENHCSTLTDQLLELEKNSANKDILESLMRASHSAKGAAKIVEVDPAIKIAHAMEDIFVACQQEKIILSKQNIDSLLSCVDLLGNISQISDEEINKWIVDHSNDIKSLSETLNAISKGNSPSELSSACEPIKDPTQTTDGPIQTSEKKKAPLNDIHNMSMLDLFRVEAENHCDILSHKLIDLEKEPNSPEILESLMRAAHSLKGAARIVELDPAIKIAHAMEDVFVAGQNGVITLDKQCIDLLLQGVDILDDIAKMDDADAFISHRQEEINSLVSSFQSFAKQKENGQQPEIKTEAPQQKLKKAEDKENQRSIRISAENMSRLMGLAGEVLIESRWLPTFSSKMRRLKQKQDEILQVLETINENISDVNTGQANGSRMIDLRKKIEICRNITIENIAIVETHSRHSSEISHRLYHEAIASRMLPFSEGIKGFPRMVRDLARELGKEVKFEIIGADTPVDRDILEKIEAPLNHLLRNALDHGLENPEDRVSKNKPREANLRLEIRHRAGMLNIIVEDDGKGINLKQIRQTVINKKLVSEEIAEDLTDAELMEFLFLPNFSTKESVDKISGRGVGMDVVHSVLHEIRGVIHSSTKLDQGTRFELQLPLTLSVMRALLAEISHEPYAFPLVNIDHVIKVSQDQIKEVQGRQYFTFNDRRIGLVSGQQVLQTLPKPLNQDTYDVIVFSDRMNQYGIIVDRFWGIRDLVVQALDPKFGKIKDISSASILEDGTPVLIIDVEDMVRSVDILISDNLLKRIGQSIDADDENGNKRILVADDSITVREVEKEMLSAKGYDVDVAFDGIDAWNTLRTKSYDLIITDVDMPRMDGIELITQIKKDHNLSDIPIVIVSYKDRIEDRHRGLEAGADYYLTKGSFKDEALVNAVVDLIGNAPRENVQQH